MAIIGEGFSALPAGALVRLLFEDASGGRPLFLGSTALTPTGTFEFTFTVPNFPQNTYTVYARADGAAAEAEFTITNEPPAPPTSDWPYWLKAFLGQC